MTRIITLAQIAANVYNSKSAGVFQRRSYTKNGWNGFAGAIYDLPGAVVVAFAGTDGGVDLISDMQLATGWMPSQAADARKLLFEAYATMGDRQVLMTGHSLGGALCQVLGYEDVPFVSFNAPPMATNLAASWSSTGARAAVTTGLGILSGGLVAAIAYAGSTKARQLAIGNVKPHAGVNLRLPYDPVSAAQWGGGHVGTVVQLPAPAWTFNRHSMRSVIGSLQGPGSNVGMMQLRV